MRPRRLLQPVVGRYYLVRRPGQYSIVKARLIRCFTERLLSRYTFFNTATRQNFTLKTLKSLERGDDLQYKEIV